MSAIINGITCDPTPETHIYTASAGERCFTGDGFQRFDTELHRTPDGYWFLVRPLAPDEAREWLEYGGHDRILARRLFPDDDRG